MELKFGQRCEITAKLVRKSKTRIIKNSSGRTVDTTFKYWGTVPFHYHHCLFLGTRTLKNGEITWDDEGWVFEAKEHFKAAVVCPGPNSSPIYVPTDAVKPTPDPTAAAVLKVCKE